MSEEKINPGLGSSIMVSVSKNGHFQKHSTTEMGVAIIPCTLEKVTVDLCPVSGSQKTYYGLFVKYRVWAVRGCDPRELSNIRVLMGVATRVTILPLPSEETDRK